MEVMDLDVADGCLVGDAATFSEEELALPDEKNQEAMVQTLRTIFQDYCQATVRSAARRRFRSWSRRTSRKWWIRSL